MDIKEAERVVIAKPVASKPNCSNFRSFSELLAGAINASPPNVCSETAVPAIRPKIVRFRPTVNRSPVALVSSQAEASGTAVSNSSDKETKSDIKQTVVYKPQAKLVSKTTVSLLSTMGNFSHNQQQRVPSVEVRVQHPKQDQSNFASQNASNIHRTVPSSPVIAEHSTEPSRLSSQNQEDDSKTLPSTANTDRPSYDGYNWRKYGQKQVKGSEYPRSYYKCTHPNCLVKKKVERSFDGQIAEIVYKGEHNHPKPQPPKRTTSGAQGLVSGGTAQDTNNPVWSNQANERNEGSQGRVENQNETGLPAPPSYQSRAPPPYDPAGTSSLNAAGTSDNSCGLSSEGKGLEVDDEEPKSKKRRTENQTNETAMSEPRVVVQSSTDYEILGDGFRWRKYGQKVVKGNPYPRSYYRCTSLKCNVRKHVERASEDPRAFITTYEGKHNHEMPSRSSNPSASEPDSQPPVNGDK